MKIIVTGAAGFIGFWLIRSLADKGVEVVGVDNLNDYYSPAYKLLRLREVGIDAGEASSGRMAASGKFACLRFLRLDIADREAVMTLFRQERPTHVVNLAAQAGVRWSISHPYDYIHSNIDGFLSILEAARHYPVEHLVYASSSSVYGMNSKIPFSESDGTDAPESLYAATKRSNELMAHVYGRLYGIRSTGLRFFTVYGPWGRPDMAPMLFARSILEGDAINVFNHGVMKRDFTYIADIVEGMEKVLESPPAPGQTPVYNIGHGSPVDLMDFISTLEEILGRKVEKNMLPMQPGDVPVTYADTTTFETRFGYKASTGLRQGLEAFAGWLTGSQEATSGVLWHTHRVDNRKDNDS